MNVPREVDLDYLGAFILVIPPLCVSVFAPQIKTFFSLLYILHSQDKIVSQLRYFYTSSFMHTVIYDHQKESAKVA